jgi:hypothetical protein
LSSPSGINGVVQSVSKTRKNSFIEDLNVSVDINGCVRLQRVDGSESDDSEDGSEDEEEEEE